jgi:glycerate kinase
MHVVVAPDKFKGSLTVAEVAARIAAGIRAVAPDATVDEVPVADGGDGTVDAALAAGYGRIPVRPASRVTSPAGGLCCGCDEFERRAGSVRHGPRDGHPTGRLA